jgi:hypothetical protein
LKNANCISFFYGDGAGQNNRSWSAALTAANSLAGGYCGLTDSSVAGDWRLPNVKELQSLIDFGQSSPALPSGHPFTGVHSSNHWSSITSPYNTSNAWHVDLGYGMVNDNDKGYDIFYVWPVRGGN